MTPEQVLQLLTHLENISLHLNTIAANMKYLAENATDSEDEPYLQSIAESLKGLNTHPEFERIADSLDRLEKLKRIGGDY